MATSEDIDVATREDFFMATDSLRWGHSRLANYNHEAPGYRLSNRQICQ
jgi:hypothetical protein